MRPIQDVAADLGFAPVDLQPWGPGVVKIAPEAAFRSDPLNGRLVLVSAISPTPAGEGKTTCTIGLTQAARRLGVRAACALREPSLGPVFGAKGGGTGGGKSSLVPSERINLHFTGDIHAVDSRTQPAGGARRQRRVLPDPAGADCDSPADRPSVASWT